MTTFDAQPRNSEQEFERPNGPQASKADGKQDKPSFASNGGSSSNTLIIDWDGPEDAENPKKQAFISRL
jgi:hypothetical protein